MSYQTTAAVELECGSEAEQLDKDIPSEVELSIDDLIVNHRENGRKLARSLLRRWRVRMAPEETDSIVDLTLCEAAHRFCPDRGASFMTFFYYHLRGHLVRAVASAANASNIFLAYAQSNNLEIGDWNGPADQLLRHFLPETAIFGKNDEESPEQALLKKEKLEQCQKAISKLDELEQIVINRSFSNEEQLVNIASSLGYSRCHISRVKKRALERLRAELNVRKQSEELQEQAAPMPKTLTARIGTAARKKSKRRRRRRISTQGAVQTPETKVA